MSSLFTDLRYSARSLARSPGRTLALLFSISLGIGSTITVQGFIRGLTGRNIPLVPANRVVSLFGRDSQGGLGSVSYNTYLSLKTHLRGAEWTGAVRTTQAPVTLAGRPAILTVGAVTAELARRSTLPLKDGALISYRLWQDEFGGKTQIRGEVIRLGGVDRQVEGVAPDGLAGPYSDRAVDIWIPLRAESLDTHDRSARNVWMLAGLGPGISIHNLQDSLQIGLANSNEINIVPYSGTTPETSEGLSRVAALLRAAAGFAYFVACVNVAAFLLGRAASRAQETSLRVALGAGRGRLARAVLADSLIVSVTGGALGVLLAAWTSKVLPAFLFQQDADLLVLDPEPTAIIASSALGVAIILLFGLAPLLETPHNHPADVLRRESAGPSRRIRSIRVSLVIAQMACCCLLVISTAFLYDSFRTALRTRASRQLGNPLLATVQAGTNVGARYFRDVQRAAQSVSGVSGNAWTSRLPGGQPAWRSFRIEPSRLPLREVRMDMVRFAPDLLKQFALPPVAGRMFDLGDQTCPTAIVNEEAAGELFGTDTVGRSVLDPAGHAIEIAGIVTHAVGSTTWQHQPTVYLNQPRPAFDRIPQARFRMPVATTLERAEFNANVVSSSYFAAMGQPLAAGQMFSDDPAARRCRVALVNQDAADLYFTGGAVGAAVIDDTGHRTDIIGIVNSPRLGTFQRRAEPAIYFPMAQDALPRMTLILSTNGASDAMLADLRRVVDSVAGSGPAPPVIRTLETYLGQTSLAPLRIATVIIGASTAIALFLSVLGLYGAFSDTARQRSRELAVRIALGAGRRHLIGGILREGGRLAVIGALTGTLGSVLLARLWPQLAQNGGSPKLWVWFAGPAVLAAAVAIASVLPARRSSMVDPLSILKESR